MVARVKEARVTVDLDMLENTARSQCARRNVRMEADVLGPTDVPVCMVTLVDTVRLTTGLVHVTGVLTMASVVLSYMVWSVPGNCVVPPLARDGDTRVRGVLPSWSVTLDI